MISPLPGLVWCKSDEDTLAEGLPPDPDSATWQRWSKLSFLTVSIAPQWPEGHTLTTLGAVLAF